MTTTLRDMARTHMLDANLALSQARIVHIDESFAHLERAQKSIEAALRVLQEAANSAMTPEHIQQLRESAAL